MKKSIVLILALLMILPITACSKSNEWPSKTVEFIIPFAPGGDSDTYLRAAAEIVGKDLGIDTIVTNMTTGAGMVSHCHDAKPDGYTVMFYNTSMNGNFANGQYDDNVVGEMPCLGSIVHDETYALVGRAGEEYETLADIQRVLQAEPRSLRFGTNVGTLIGWLSDQIQDSLDIEFEYVNVGSDNATRLLGVLNGEADFMLGNLGNFTEYIADGQITVFGILAHERNYGFPDVPTLEEQGCPVYMEKYYEFRVPAGTPQDIIDKLSASLEKVTQDKEFIALTEKWGSYATYTNGADQDKIDRADIDNQKPYYESTANH